MMMTACMIDYNEVLRIAEGELARRHAFVDAHVCAWR